MTVRDDQSRSTDASRRSVGINVHGSAVDLRCGLPGLRQVIADLLGEMIVDGWPDGFAPAEGWIDRYDADVVARSLSSTAKLVAVFTETAELWADGERLWLIDEAWGVCELNLLRRTFRSWVLDQALLDPVRCLEQAVLWPMSQVLIGKNVSLLPASGFIHEGRGILLISPFSAEAELAMLASAGHALISQRWVAIREDPQSASRPMMQRVGMLAEHTAAPQPRSRLSHSNPAQGWVDLYTTYPTAERQARCDAIMVIEPGRRTTPSVRQLTGASSSAAVRRAWPIPDSPMGPKQSQFAGRLAAGSQVFQVELSRDAKALLRLLHQLPTDHAIVRPTALTPRRLPQTASPVRSH